MSKQLKKSLVLTLVGLSVAMIATATLAKPPGRGGPPPEAVEACVNLAEGDACSFEGRRGETLEGQCVLPPRGEEDVLACLPEGGPGGRGRPE